ncbi:antitoxin VbhA family protein [Arthrobacter sp. H5]|uniref:antitoxin VbhA family protein n=1 Tax=Arthrobacter sp. H5 TaxID=1267973 RepID=UPI0004B74BBA|nr:antitoxin VbhA family protein [Arthrobacter sp. H5]
MAIKVKPRAVQRTESEVESDLSFADAALGVAGHQVKDLGTRELGWRIARGEITGDQAVQLTKDRYPPRR